MNAFWAVWNAITPYGLVAFLILAAVALIITAASAGRLTDHWLGLRVGAPRDRVAELNTGNAWRERDEAILRGIHDEASRRLALYGPDWPGAWPADLCAYPPCSTEDGWLCDQHQAKQPACTCTTYADHETGRVTWITCSTCRPAGRHHRRADVITATIAQLDEWRRAQ